VSGGVEVSFANPGTSEMHFVAALDKVPGMRCVLCLHETVTTGAADGYYRMAGKARLDSSSSWTGARQRPGQPAQSQAGAVRAWSISWASHAHLPSCAMTPCSRPMSRRLPERCLIGSGHRRSKPASPKIALKPSARRLSRRARWRRLFLPADVAWSDDAAGPASVKPAAIPAQAADAAMEAAAKGVGRR